MNIEDIIQAMRLADLPKLRRELERKNQTHPEFVEEVFNLFNKAKRVTQEVK